MSSFYYLVVDADDTAHGPVEAIGPRAALRVAAEDADLSDGATVYSLNVMLDGGPPMYWTGDGDGNLEGILCGLCDEVSPTEIHDNAHFDLIHGDEGPLSTGGDANA